jgi:glycosyltransferase involved in cell wall biosynthesis
LKVLLITNYPLDEQQSMARYAQWLQSALSTAHDVTVCGPVVYLGRCAARGTGLAKWLGYIDKFLIFPFTLRRLSLSADVVHICDHGNAMYVRHLRGVPHVITCHDLLAIRSALGQIPGLHTSITGRFFQWMIRKGLEKAQAVVCVSNATLQDLKTFAPDLMSMPVLVENPLNWPYQPMSKDVAWQKVERLSPEIQRPFFLHVGGNQWYKNRAGAIRIFAALRRLSGEFTGHSLLMVGKEFTEEMKQEVTPPIQASVRQLTAIDNETLQALYSACDALIFPSLAEGFGWPIVEAQACHALVITSDLEPMNEIAGGGAILVTPDQPELAARQIADAWPWREAIREAGSANVSRFSAEVALQKYIRVYQSVRPPGLG